MRVEALPPQPLFGRDALQRRLDKASIAVKVVGSVISTFRYDKLFLSVYHHFINHHQEGFV